MSRAVNHASARAAVDELFIGRGRRLRELRSHLDGCVECRAHYDRTVGAFRARSGKPDEMTAEELSLFGPKFREGSPVRAKWPLVWLGGLAVAATAVLVVFIRQPPPPEFNPRGTHAPLPEQPTTRALCLHGDDTVGDAAEGGCTDADRISFVAVGRGKRFVAITLVAANAKVEVVVSGEAGALEEEKEAFFPRVSAWRPGARAVAIYGDAAISAELAQRCAVRDCPASLELREIPLVRSKP